jgi:hypothetical protein
MEGYEVITSDERELGQVVDVRGDYLIVEHGLLRKKRHAVPRVFAEPDAGENVVRLTVSEEMVDTSPKLDDDSIDETAVARHYGLAAGEEDPETKGYGEVLPDDPARSAEEEELRTGVEPAASRRVRIQQGRSEAGRHGRQIIPSDPHDGP